MQENGFKNEIDINCLRDPLLFSSLLFDPDTFSIIAFISSSIPGESKPRKKNSDKNKSCSILALGNCDGKIMFYDIDSDYEGKIFAYYWDVLFT